MTPNKLYDKSFHLSRSGLGSAPEEDNPGWGLSDGPIPADILPGTKGIPAN